MSVRVASEGRPIISSGEGVHPVVHRVRWACGPPRNVGIKQLVSPLSFRVHRLRTRTYCWGEGVNRFLGEDLHMLGSMRLFSTRFRALCQLLLFRIWARLEFNRSSFCCSSVITRFPVSLHSLGRRRVGDSVCFFPSFLLSCNCI
jgi:hypothetical protein